MHIDPSSLDHTERYKLLTGGVVPRPIAWVTTVGPTGVVNAAPYSFFNAASVTPMVLMIGPANTIDGADKDTTRNIERSGEFVVNVVDERHVRHAAATAEELGPEVSELDDVGLDTVPSRVVGPPRIAGSPCAFECAHAEIIRFDGRMPRAGNVVFGHVVSVHVDDAVIDATYRIDPEGLGAVGRMAGAAYVSTRHRFDVPRGRDALSIDPPEFA